MRQLYGNVDLWELFSNKKRGMFEFLTSDLASIVVYVTVK